MSEWTDELPHPDCLPVEEIGAALDRGSKDPARVHVEECPRCRALAKELTAFRTGADRADDLAVERLHRALRSEIFGEQHQVVRRPRIVPMWRPVLAAAAIVLVVIGMCLVWGNMLCNTANTLSGSADLIGYPTNVYVSSGGVSRFSSSRISAITSCCASLAQTASSPGSASVTTLIPGS